LPDQVNRRTSGLKGHSQRRSSTSPSGDADDTDQVHQKSDSINAPGKAHLPPAAKLARKETKMPEVEPSGPSEQVLAVIE